MANSEAGSSSDTARALGGEYQVFLNFRGPDTRHGFTDFLYCDLVNAGVRVFRDEDELRVGEVIGGNLLRAINSSMIYIPIFSVTYASSKWCLRELAHIRDNVSKSEGEKCILPIFFHVEPEDVKLRTSLYSDALLEHEKNFPVEEVKWRKALVEVGKIKGWNVKKDESQATIVKLVVERVLEKLKLKQRLVPEHLVGLDDRVKHLTELLDVNHRNVRVIGIYGMGGIGKTTVAKVVFNELLSHFGKCSSFLENVREKMSTEDGIVQLQKKLLFDIVDSGSAGGVQDVEQGMRRIGEVFSTKKVLVVLDDADNKDHIKRLIGNNSLHSGSRIIITTRNKTILQGQEFKDEIIPYEMLKMDDAPALELFCRHAFGKNFPSDDYHSLSKELVLRTGGLPLAVEVIGSLLKGKDKAFWKETKIKLRNVPEEEILKKLKISYEDLEEYQQQIFLDIACFFFNEKKTNAIDVWDHCGFYPNIGIPVLINRCLIKILDNDKFWMHDQLRDMGRRIVDQESPNDLGNRSRLLIGPKQALEIRRTKERKDKVQALKINGYGNLAITKEVFERFPNLRFLKLESVTFTGDFANCPSNVKCIYMEGPLNAISRLDMRADNMYLEHLAVFKLVSNQFEDDSKVWDLIKRARALKVLSLSGCNGITRIPDFSECLSLERLTLAYCQVLKKIESFIGKLRLLIELEIEECSGLTDLPEEVGALGKLQRFSLRGCSGLRELPGSLGNLTSLEELWLFRTKIRELPNSIKKLKSLRVLHFAIGPQEDHAWHFPSGISMLVKLEELDISGHKGMKGEIPDGIGGLSLLKILNLKSTGICRIPGTIDMLHCLQMLDLSNCHEIQELPKFPTSLTCLRVESESLLSVPNLSYLTSLEELLLSNQRFAQKNSKPLTGCKLRWIKSLSKLKQLDLGLHDVLAPLELAFLPHLEVLRLTGLDLRPLMQLLSSTHNWRCLLMGISDCEVEDIPLEGLARLEVLSIYYCMQLQRLFIPLESRKLQKVTLSGCKELVEIRVADLSESLEILGVYQCISLTRISGLLYLKNLKKLNIQDCHVLTNVEGLDELESLEYLRVEMCTSLERLIDASCTKIPDNCLIYINSCGNYIIDFGNALGKPLKLYKELILQVQFIRDPRSLIELEIVNCKGLKNLPKEVGTLVKLEHLSLRGCSKLSELPSSLGNLTSLIELDLSNTRIRELPNSIGELSSLRILNLVGTDICKIPRTINMLHHLQTLDLSQCEEIQELPELVIELEIVNFKGLTNLPEEMGTLAKLKRFSLQGCSKLRELPSSLGNLTSLIELDLSGTGIRKLPDSIGELSSLRILNLACTDIYGIPSTITMLHHLQTLNFSWCDEIQDLPKLPTNLTCLLLVSTSLRSVTNLSNLTNLVELQLWDGSMCMKESNLVSGCNLRWIGRLSRLEKLDLELLSVPTPPELASLSHLKELVLKGLDLKPLMQFPSSEWSWGNLSTLGLYSCEVEDIPLAGLPGLENFTVEDCVRLQRLSISSGLTKLRHVDVSRCPRLVEMRVGGLLKSLEDLTIEDCKSLTRISGLSYLKNLKTLGIYWCKVLTNVEGLDELESLETLSFIECMSLRRFIDASLTKIPDDCELNIAKCGNSIRDSEVGMSLNHYREEILRNTSNKVNRDRTMETDRMPTKTGRGSGTSRGSNPGRSPAERGRGRDIASSSRNSKGLRLGSHAASTLGKGKASNSGRSISSTSRSSVTSSSGRDTILSSVRGRGSSSIRDTANMGTSSSSGRGIASSSRSSLTLSTGRGRGSTSGKGAAVSLGRGTTEMGAGLRSGVDKGSSNPRSSMTLSIGRGRGLTSEEGATVHPGRDATLSLGKGATEMGSSLRSGTDKGSSSAKTKPQTSSS